MDGPADDLVMAMPRRELWSLHGFLRNVELRILESVADESWFATPQSIRDDIEAKEVRIGLVVVRGGDWLVHEEGVVLHVSPVPSAITHLGGGLKALRDLARLAGRHLVGADPCGCELVGYLNEDALVEARPFFILVYRLFVRADTAAPPGMAWVSAGALRDLPLEPVSAVIAAGLAA